MENSFRFIGRGWILGWMPKRASVVQLQVAAEHDDRA